MSGFRAIAALGGVPCVPNELRVANHPVLSRTDRNAVSDQIDAAISIYDDSGIYRSLENAWSNAIGLPNVLTVNSGTSALLSSYYGLGLERGTEVIVPCYNFFAAATPLFILGLVPVLADCSFDGNIDPRSIAELIGPRTGAISVTHMWGYPCDMGSIVPVASAAGLPIVEDASHAHGARLDGKPIGTFGEVAAWSLQGKKIITAGEGGLLATASQEVFERAVLLGHFNRRALANVRNPRLRIYADTGAGLNLRMHPLGAALAVNQVSSLERQVAERRESASVLLETLAEIDGLHLTEVLSGAEPSFYALTVRFDRDFFPGVSRELFVKALHAEGAIEVDVPGATRPLSNYELFHSASRLIPGAFDAIVPDRDSLQGSERYWESVVKMPTFYGPDRILQADAYGMAFRRVAAARSELAKLPEGTSLRGE